MLQVEYTRGDPGTEALIKTLDAFPISVEEEFLAWQKDDMKRQFPNIRHGQSMWGQDSMAWDVFIWPRSRAQKWEKWRPWQGRPRGRAIAFTGRRRPILRPELFEMLRERMRALLNKVVP